MSGRAASLTKPGAVSVSCSAAFARIVKTGGTRQDPASSVVNFPTASPNTGEIRPLLTAHASTRTGPLASRVRALCLLLLTILLVGGPAAWPSDLLTPAERAWLAAHPSIRLGVGAEWAPWVIPTQDGGLTGFAADHLRLLGDKLGVTIGLEAGPWHAMVAAAEARRLDGLTLAAALP